MKRILAKYVMNKVPAVLLAAMLAAAVAAVTLPLSGCTTKYGRRDIEKYVREKYGIENFTVSSERKEIAGSDDRYIDYLWTVTEDDGTVFNVVDDYYWGTEWVSNSLIDNRNTVHLRKYLISAQYPGFEMEESAPRSSYIDFIKLRGSFKSRAELDERLDTLDALAKDMPAGLFVPYVLEYDHKYRTIDTYSDTAGDSSGSADAGEKISRDEPEKNLLHCALDLRYDDVVAEFTAADIRDLLEDRYVFKIGIADSDGNVEYYDDLIESRYYYGISFPSMYEVLVRNEYPVEGDKDDFSIIALDGSTYRFSLDFKENQSYYYIKDGEHVPMDCYFYDHFDISIIEKLTGIKAIDGYKASRAEKEKERQAEASAADAP